MAASPLLREALARHQAGDLTGAEALYRAVLAATPDDADALHLLGLIAHRRGHHNEALAAIGRAVHLRPTVALYRGNLSRAMVAAGQWADAALSLREAIALDPGNADFHYELGLVLARLGRPAEAVPCYQTAIALSPDHAPAHNNLGVAFDALGLPVEAETHFRASIRLNPALAEAHANLGGLLCRLGRAAEAEQSIRRSLALSPRFPEALNTLGSVLTARRDHAGAEAAIRTALALDPAYPEALNNLGVLLTEQGRFDEARDALGAALACNPRYAEAESNLGNVLAALGRLPEAEAAHRRALAIAPNEAEAEYNFGVALLLAGRLSEGWARYERRWDRRGAREREFAQPLWFGDDLAGRSLLVHAEQGLGDTIQFCRFMPLLNAEQIVLEVPRPLVRLLGRLPGIDRLVARGDPLPPTDLHCPLMSLPHRLGTTLETIPATVPYLFADPDATKRWRQKLVHARAVTVGLAWAGNPEYAADGRRSIHPALLAPLLQMPDACFVSLQQGPAPEGLPILAFPGQLDDFADTAGLIAALDLVISVDTAVAHLAGALGKPVWLLNRFDSCWRWLCNRDDSPWYPTLRQFRQTRPGDWAAVLAAARASLNRWIRDLGEPGR